jgi:hypothetical protein
VKERTNKYIHRQRFFFPPSFASLAAVRKTETFSLILPLLLLSSWRPVCVSLSSAQIKSKGKTRRNEFKNCAKKKKKNRRRDDECLQTFGRNISFLLLLFLVVVRV